MAVEAVLPTLGVVLFTAFIDSINPCAIGVLILLISVLMTSHATPRKMFKIGIVYISAVAMIYFLAGLGLMKIFSIIPLMVSMIISIIVGSLVVIGGLIEVKDYFWYGKGISLMIPPSMAKKIHEYSQQLTFPSVVMLGAFVAAVELPCTGGPYLAIITLLSQYFNMTAFFMLILYNIIFVLPLIVILLLVLIGTKVHRIKRWKHSNRAYMRLLSGIMMILLGWILILIANGTLNLG